MKNKIPKTLEEAVEFLIVANKKQIKKLKKEEMSTFHHSTGMNIRNAWGLWDKESDLWNHFFNRFGLQHADDMSGLIFDCFKNEINNEKWTINKTLLEYKTHWMEWQPELSKTIKYEGMKNESI